MVAGDLQQLGGGEEVRSMSVLGNVVGGHCVVELTGEIHAHLLHVHSTSCVRVVGDRCNAGMPMPPSAT